VAKIGASMMIDRPVDEVWRYSIDWSKGPQWDPGLVECKVTSEGPLGVGTTLQSKRTTRGAKLIDFRVAEYEPGRMLTAEVMSPHAMRGTRITQSLESVEGKTKVNIAWDMKLHGFYSLFGPLLAREANKGCETQVGNLKRVIESQAKS